MNKKSLLVLPFLLFYMGCDKKEIEQKEVKNSKEILNKYFVNPEKDKENALAHKISDLTIEELDMVLLGQSFFRIPWVEAPSATTARDGLGPLFNANTCAHCHPNNGSGKVYKDDGSLHRSFLYRLSKSKNFTNDELALKEKIGFVPDPIYGAQLSIHSTLPTVHEGKQKVTYEEVDVKYFDGTVVKLQKPTYEITGLNYGPLDKDTVITARMASALIGMRHLNNIKVEDIVSYEDKDDKNGDGISGKANWVFSAETNKTELGRFTWKASSPSSRHQSAAAFNNDMGITTPLMPQENCTKHQEECIKMSKYSIHEHDATAERLTAVDMYITHFKVPIPKKINKKGKELFNAIGCAKCHVESFVTSEGIKVSPYSDMLLHDMGEGLSDGRSEFLANANEWRTQPLWGIGLKTYTAGSAYYLHDGRARTIEEAILWHGGEAQIARDTFMGLTKEQREDILEFLNQL